MCSLDDRGLNEQSLLIRFTTKDNLTLRTINHALDSAEVIDVHNSTIIRGIFSALRVELLDIGLESCNEAVDNFLVNEHIVL